MNNNNYTYKPSPMGNIPSDWEVKELHSCSEFITKGATPTTYGFSWVNEGVVFLRSECVSERGLDLGAAMFISEEADKVMHRSSLKECDILMTITGNVGRICKIPNGFPKANINQHIARIRIIDTLYEREFIFQYLKQDKISKEYLKITTGQAYPQISLAQVRNTTIPIPPLPEQKAIAHILSLMDAAINKNNSLIAKKELQKKWLMQNLLSGKKRLMGFEGEWKSEILGNLVDLQHGYQFRDEDFVSEGIPVIKIRNVIGHQLVLTDMTFVDKNRLEEFKSVVIKNGDLLMSLTGNIGRVVEVEGAEVPMFQNYRVGKFTPKGVQITKSFLKFLLSSDVLFRQFNGLANQSAQANFGKQDMNKLKFKFPVSTDEQNTIAQVLQAADKEIQLLKAKTEKLREQKKGLMQVLLTGKKRLRI